MAIAEVSGQVATTGTDPFNSSTTATLSFPSSTTTGNAVAVIVRSNGIVISSVSDGTNTYTNRVADATQDPFLTVFTAHNITGTASALTVTLAQTSGFSWAYAIELSGVDTTSPIDTTDHITGTGGITDLVSHALTTAGAGAVILAASQNSFMSYSAGTNYILDNGNIGVESGFPGSHLGGVEHRITSGALSSEVQHITSTSSNQYTLVLVALKAAAGGASFLARPNPTPGQAVNRASTW